MHKLPESGSQYPIYNFLYWILSYIGNSVLRLRKWALGWDRLRFDFVLCPLLCDLQEGT